MYLHVLFLLIADQILVVLKQIHTIVTTCIKSIKTAVYNVHVLLAAKVCSVQLLSFGILYFTSSTTRPSSSTQRQHPTAVEATVSQCQMIRGDKLFISEQCCDIAAMSEDKPLFHLLSKPVVLS